MKNEEYLQMVMIWSRLFTERDIYMYDLWTEKKNVMYKGRGGTGVDYLQLLFFNRSTGRTNTCAQVSFYDLVRYHLERGWLV
jgi:hypothetical protein